jgi:hypothetical protein
MRAASNTTRVQLLAAALLAAVGGCGGPERGEVSGVVTQEGRPVQGVMVYLHAENGSGHEFAGGPSDAEGRYKVRYAPSFGGVYPGEYKVTVGLSPDPMEDEDDRPRRVGPRPVLPREFTARDRTPLTVKVATGQNAVNVELPAGKRPAR